MNSTKDKKKLIVRISGGLGNQLFSYAAARRLAIKNNAELIIDDVSGFMYDYMYCRKYCLDNFNIPFRRATFNERLEPFSRFRRKIKRMRNELFPFLGCDYITQKMVDFDSSLLEQEIKKTSFIEGYWQSELYFKDVEDIIRRDLEIAPPSDPINTVLSEKIKNTNAVAIHIRFFCQAPGSSTNISCEYYNRAIKLIEESTTNPHYFIFSDQPNRALEKIQIPSSRFTLVNHNQGDINAYADLWLMTLCKHFIIANSTFSWWGAWLSKNLDKKIIAPGVEIRSGVAWWGFKGLLPANWVIL